MIFHQVFLLSKSHVYAVEISSPRKPMVGSKNLLVERTVNNTKGKVLRCFSQLRQRIWPLTVFLVQWLKCHRVHGTPGLQNCADLSVRLGLILQHT
jgi:hypothetical protein